MEKTTSDSHVHRTVSPFLYDLYAVCNHYGNLQGGHYTGGLCSTLDIYQLCMSRAYSHFYHTTQLCCLSVCLSHACFVINQTMHCSYFDTARKDNHFSFLTPTVIGWRRPLLSEICTQSDPPTVEKRRLWQISAYNVSTIRDSEESLVMMNRKSATGCPTIYRWSTYVTPKSPKGCVRSDFFVFFL